MQNRIDHKLSVVAAFVSNADLIDKRLAQAPLQLHHLRMSDSPPRLDLVFQKYDPPLYFVTFNTYRRQQLLANNAVHARLMEFANEGAARGISIGRYVIMPDHVHLFVRGTRDYPLTQWMRLLKRKLSKAIALPLPHWQKGFFDHLIRHSESYSQKWDYVWQNPVRAGLVASPEQWPWQGEIVCLMAT